MANNKTDQYTIYAIKQLLKTSMDELYNITIPQKFKRKILKEYDTSNYYNKDDEAVLINFLEPISEIEIAKRGKEIILYFNIYNDELTSASLNKNALIKDEILLSVLNYKDNLKRFWKEESKKLVELTEFYHKNLPNPFDKNNLFANNKARYIIPIDEYTDVIINPFFLETIIINDRIISNNHFENDYTKTQGIIIDDITINAYNIPNNMKKIMEKGHLEQENINHYQRVRK